MAGTLSAMPGDQESDVLPLAELGERIRLTDRVLLALYSTEIGELRWGDASEAQVNDLTMMPFFGCGPDGVGDVLGRRVLDSSADLVLPVPDVDSLSTVAFKLYYSVDTQPVLIVETAQLIPRGLLVSLLQSIADDLNEEPYDLSGWKDLAHHTTWYLNYALRRRIRNIEESVRASLMIRSPTTTTPLFANTRNASRRSNG